MTVPGGNRALSPRREETSPSDGEMPRPESLRGDDAERAKGTDVSGDNWVRQRWYAAGSQKHGRRALSVRLSCEATSSFAEPRLEAAPACCLLLLPDSACRPSSGRSAVGHVQNPAKKGRSVDTLVAKEHGKVPSRAWQAVGLALSTVLAASGG